MRAARALTVAALAALLGAVAGCGLGPGEVRKGGAELRVTRDFGQRLLASARRERVREGETVMRFLQSERRVKTRYGGGFVQSIDGLSGRGPAGREDWFYFVNGIEADVGAAERRLYPGDVVQWDYRPWAATMRVPALVGAYPEPFVHGSEGKRFPARVECERPDGPACREARSRLSAAGVPVSAAPLGVAAGEEVLRLVVGNWPALRDVRAAATLERGPAASGVFARVAAGGRRLELLDSSGRPARTAPPGSGLVAATALPGEQIVWLVTGLDDAGVEAAARALDERTLRDAFAVAATPDGAVRLPVREGSSG